MISDYTIFDEASAPKRPGHFIPAPAAARTGALRSYKWQAPDDGDIVIRKARTTARSVPGDDPNVFFTVEPSDHNIYWDDMRLAENRYGLDADQAAAYRKIVRKVGSREALRIVRGEGGDG